MLLHNKNAVIYGGGGAVGGAVARAFAAEGARVILVGRTLATLEKKAGEIRSAGGKTDVAQVDAMDEQAVTDHLEAVVQEWGSIDISFNLMGMGDAQGKAILDMTRDHFALPVINVVHGHFVTAAAAGRQMVKQRSGVILALTAQAGRKPYTNVGGFGVACAAIEGMCRQFALELGSSGIRVVCLRSAGSPDTPGVDEVFNMHAQKAGISRREFDIEFAEKTMLKRLPRLPEVANAAVLMASDKASAMTAVVANVTCGELVD